MLKATRTSPSTTRHIRADASAAFATAPLRYSARPLIEGEEPGADYMRAGSRASEPT